MNTTDEPIPENSASGQDQSSGSQAPSSSPAQPEAAARRPDGTFMTGNTFSLKTGQFSARAREGLLPGQVPALFPEIQERIERDLGGASELSELKAGMVEEAAALRLLMVWQRDDLMRKGLLTSRGRTRSMFTSYLATLNAYMKVATTLGLERRPKRTTTIDDIIAEYAQRRASEPQDETSPSEPMVDMPDTSNAVEAAPSLDTNEESDRNETMD